MNALEVFCGGIPVQPLGPPLRAFPGSQPPTAPGSTQAWTPKLAGLDWTQGNLVGNLALTYALHAAGWAIANALLGLKLDAKSIFLGAGISTLLEPICKLVLQRITQ